MSRIVIVLSVLVGLGLGIVKPVIAQPESDVPFTFECVLWEEAYTPLPARMDRAIYTAIGSVVLAGLVAVIDLKNILDLPFDPKLVVIGFLGLGMAASLADFWFTNERIAEMQLEGIELGCLERIQLQ